jgi:hypothetical protein
VYDTGKHFEINGISRFIKETSATKLVLVQGDHDSEVITFQMPRYIDGHDTLLCNKIRVHYINLDTKTNDKSADIYEVTDLTLCEECEDVLAFTWVIEAPATKYSGTLSFLVKFECTEGENVLYQWNTAKYVSVNVLAGIDNSEEFVEKYSNVLEEWYNELTKGADSIEELNQQAIAEIELAKEDAKEDIQGKADATMTAMNEFSTNTYNSFKNDVDEKASRTLESIPEAYEELDEKVQITKKQVNEKMPLNFSCFRLDKKISGERTDLFVGTDFLIGDEITYQYKIKDGCTVYMMYDDDSGVEKGHLGIDSIEETEIAIDSFVIDEGVKRVILIGVYCTIMTPESLEIDKIGNDDYIVFSNKDVGARIIKFDDFKNQIGAGGINASYNLKATEISNGVVEISLITAKPESPENGVEQVGSTLIIVSGVSASQSGTTLSIE